MAGNPFAEVLRAPLTLALRADRQSGQKKNTLDLLPAFLSLPEAERHWQA